MARCAQCDLLLSRYSKNCPRCGLSPRLPWSFRGPTTPPENPQTYREGFRGIGKAASIVFIGAAVWWWASHAGPWSGVELQVAPELRPHLDRTVPAPSRSRFVEQVTALPYETGRGDLVLWNFVNRAGIDPLRDEAATMTRKARDCCATWLTSAATMQGT